MFHQFILARHLNFGYHRDHFCRDYSVSSGHSKICEGARMTKVG